MPKYTAEMAHTFTEEQNHEFWILRQICLRDTGRKYDRTLYGIQRRPTVVAVVA